jgi:HSP20 family molecular chaperone IbpA
METLKKKTTIVGMVTLIVGLLLGAGIGVWTVNKSEASDGLAETRHATPSVDQPKSSAMDEEKDPFRSFERLHEEINRAIRNATEEFELDGETALFRPHIGYSSSVDLRDRGDHFEIRAYLPDVDKSDVKVELDNQNVLHIKASQHRQEVKRNDESEAEVTEMGRYEQIITLPQPVERESMKIDQMKDEIIITIPKTKRT